VQHSVFFYIPYLFRARRDFSLKFGVLICEVVLNLHMRYQTAPRQTGSLWTGPCGAKPRPATPNFHVKSPLFWDITQHWVVISLPIFQDNLSVQSSRVRKS